MQVVCDALKDFFTKKKTRLSVNLMKALLKERPSRQAAEALMGFHGTARNVFLKAEAVQLLQALMHPSKVSQPLHARSTLYNSPVSRSADQLTLCCPVDSSSSQQYWIPFTASRYTMTP